jgi:hypothetical protein
MSDERAEYLESGSGEPPVDHERLREMRGLLSDEATWAEPPPEVGDRVIAAIRDESAEHQRDRGRSHRLRWVSAGLVATAAVVALVIGLVGLFDSGDETVVALEGTDLQTGATGQAVIGAADSGWWIRLDVEGLPAAPDGSYYEGWVWSDDGDGVSIGTFHLRDGDAPVTLWSGVDPADYPAIWVTLEDEDGDAAASDRIVLVGTSANARANAGD